MLRALCKNNTSELQDLVQLRDEHNIHVSLLNKEINLEGNKNHSFCGYSDAYIYILYIYNFFNGYICFKQLFYSNIRRLKSYTFSNNSYRVYFFQGSAVRATVIASQTHRVVNALIKVRGSFIHVVAADWHSSSSPSTVAITMKRSDVGIRQSMRKWKKLAL